MRHQFRKLLIGKGRTEDVPRESVVDKRWQNIRAIWNNEFDEDAGIELLKYVKKTLEYPIPLLLQSHDVDNARRAETIGAGFINKN